MPRPLMRLGVGQIKEMFDKGKSDPKVLKQLEHELQYRHVPKAVALLAEVQAAIYVAEAPPPQMVTPALPKKSVEPSDHQSDLWHQPSVETTSLPTVAKLAPSPPEPPAMPLDEAYKVLKGTPGSTWESIEQTRRLLVQQASPIWTRSMNAEKRAQIQTEARRANVAYATLSRYRMENKG